MIIVSICLILLAIIFFGVAVISFTECEDRVALISVLLVVG